MSLNIPKLIQEQAKLEHLAKTVYFQNGARDAYVFARGLLATGANNASVVTRQRMAAFCSARVRERLGIVD
ncbi:MAG: hypothetical protein PHN51_10180 [Candidatus Nanopelagicales bacterium]|nr:hypothetical protein [Candidatus Nanopelagicales bacterium]